MIPFDELKKITTLNQLDHEIKKREGILNAMAKTLYPQIISEEIVQLRTHQVSLQEEAVDRVSEATKCTKIDATFALIDNNWDIQAAIDWLNQQDPKNANLRPLQEGAGRKQSPKSDSEGRQADNAEAGGEEGS